MRRFQLVVIMLIAAGAMVAGGSAQAKAPGPVGQIAFARQMPAGGADVYTTNPDGTQSGQVPLTYPAEDFGVPVWSPDGQRLLISHTMRTDGNGACCLAFRPATVNPDGSAFTLLDMPSAPFDMDCQVWSRDMTRLFCGFGGEHTGVFSVRASDGGDPVRLSTNPYGTADQGAMDTPTDISPDGGRIVFLRYRPGPATPNDTAQQVAVFVENTDGTGLRQVTPFGLAQPHEIASARWSPDGRYIASEDHTGRLFVVRADGSGLRTINLQTDRPQYFAFEPDWSPDGTRLVFCMWLDHQEDVYTADTDGSDVTRVTDTPEFENGPSWGTHQRATS